MVLKEIVTFFEYLSDTTLQKIVQTNAEIGYTYKSDNDVQHNITLRTEKPNTDNGYFVLVGLDHEIKIKAYQAGYPDVLLELESALKRTNWSGLNLNDTLEITFEIMGSHGPRQVEIHISQEDYTVHIDKQMPKGLGWLTGMFADGKSGKIINKKLR